MAKPYNRSPWQVKLPGQDALKFRLESKAREHLAAHGYSDPARYPRGALRQLETAFEAQVVRKDKDGNVVRRSHTFDTYAEAEQYIAQQESLLDQILKAQGGFEVSFETITVREALEKFHEEHYKGKASYKEIQYRLPYLIEWLGGSRKLKDLTTKDFKKLRKTLETAKYSASSQRNFFTILTSFFKHARKEWDYHIVNLASNITLPKPANYVQRDWIGDEQERLMKSLQAHSPWMIPIVEMSLELSFRRGELVQGAKNKKTGEQSGGLMWEHVDWERGILNLHKEKNDGSKRVTESLGRSVPMTPKIREILRPLFESSPTKTGLVFGGTTNSVSGAFSNACKAAKPPIKKLTFHSLRKIGTKALSKRLPNAMQLKRVTGHKTLAVLDARYYDVQAEELAALLLESSGSIRHRGVGALTRVLGLKDAKTFLQEVRDLPNLDDIFQ